MIGAILKPECIIADFIGSICNGRYLRRSNTYMWSSTAYCLWMQWGRLKWGRLRQRHRWRGNHTIQKRWTTIRVEYRGRLYLEEISVFKNKDIGTNDYYFIRGITFISIFFQVLSLCNCYFGIMPNCYKSMIWLFRFK